MAALITTSRKPCRRTRTLAKDLQRLFPESTMTSRGKKSIDDCVELARHDGFSRVVLLSDYKGNPGELAAINVEEGSWEWLDFGFKILGVKLAREFSEPSFVKPHSINLNGLTDILKMFDVDPDNNASVECKATKQLITFYYKGREIGPLLKIKKVNSNV